MSFDQLNQMRRDAATLRGQCERKGNAAEAIAKLRNKPTATPLETFKNMAEWDRYHGNSVAEYMQTALNAALENVLPDILRAAELALQAQARELKIRAAQREAVITACILPIPDIGGDV